jgi:mannose-1-phosphate guanylyltransferase
MRQRSWYSVLHPPTDHRWGIILAGGQGKRLKQYIKSRFGEYRPKQYCALIGKRSMLRHTIDRVTPLFAADHLMTSVNAGHLSLAFDELHDRPPTTVVIQPYNRETGPGILLSLLHVHHHDPEAVVALFPSDHFILQEERYRSFVSRAFDVVAEDPHRIVMLGVVPTSLQYGYGWIEAGGPISAEGVCSVKRFWEKPNVHLTQYLHDKGCLWNTMTIVGTTENFLCLMKEHMSEVYEPSQRIIRSLGTTFESDVTEDVFATLPSVNFSRGFLEKIPDRLSVLQMQGVYWNDWGDEHRISSDIDILEHQEYSTFVGEQATSVE